LSQSVVIELCFVFCSNTAAVFTLTSHQLFMYALLMLSDWVLFAAECFIYNWRCQEKF